MFLFSLILRLSSPPNNASLSKFLLKYVDYRRVFWVEIQSLQRHFKSIWSLVYYYCIQISRSVKKTVIQI